MNIQGIIFDFNGTLFYDSHYHDAAWMQVSKELRGEPVTHAEIAEHFHGKNNEQIINYIMDSAIDSLKNKEISIYKESIYRHLCLTSETKPQLAEGAETFLNFLVQKQIPITIASASILDNMQFYIKTFQLERWFDPSLFVYDDGNHIDKISMFQDAAKLLHLPIEKCMVFEDSISGIRFAHEAGAKTIIAMDSVNDSSRFQQFPYLEDIFKDYTTAISYFNTSTYFK